MPPSSIADAQGLSTGGQNTESCWFSWFPERTTCQTYSIYPFLFFSLLQTHQNVCSLEQKPWYVWAFRFSRAPARLLMNSLSLVAKAGRLKGWWQENGRRMASKCCLMKQHSYFVVWGMLLLSRMFKLSYHDGGAKRERWKQIRWRQGAVIDNQQQCFLGWYRIWRSYNDDYIYIRIIYIEWWFKSYEQEICWKLCFTGLSPLGTPSHPSAIP